jgi:hypothetical protein
MRTFDELVIEVEENVEMYYEDLNVEPDDIARLSVQDVLYGISLPDTAINQYWDRLVDAAVQKFEQLTEFDRF